MTGDAAYFAERARQERAAAIQTANLQAREAHLEMARRYDELAHALGSPEPVLGSQAASP
jgi:hypothetical protein